MPNVRASGPKDDPWDSKQSQQSDFLSDWSSRDVSWDQRRLTADSLSKFFSSVADVDERLGRYAQRLWSCSGHLLFGWESQPDGSSELRLKHAQFCRVRLCPICMWRRSLMWLSRFLSVLPGILAAHSGGRWIHVTLTVRNPDIADLPATLDDMSRAWNRLVIRKAFARYILGWIRSTEVTRGSDGPMQCHPHYHVLLFVSPGYFTGKGYLSHAAWVALWRSVMKLDYDPSVHVRAVTLKRSRGSDSQRYAIPDGVDPEAWSVAISGALEVLKYSTKPADLFPKSDGDPWLVGLAKALHRRRLVAAGGVLKVVMADIEDEEDLIHGDDGPAKGEDDGSRLAFAVPPVAGSKPRRYRRDVRGDMTAEDLKAAKFRQRHEQFKESVTGDGSTAADRRRFRQLLNGVDNVKKLKKPVE